MAEGRLEECVERAKATTNKILESLRTKGISLVSSNPAIKRSSEDGGGLLGSGAGAGGDMSSLHLKESMMEANLSNSNALKVSIKV